MSSRIDITYRRIGRIAGPVLVTNLSYTAMGVIDTIMVGRLGVSSLGAVGLGNLVSFTALSFFFGLLTGVNTLVAQAYGAGDREAAGRVFWQGIYLAAVCAAAIALLWPVVPIIFRWIGPSSEVQRIATDYMQIRMLGSAGVVFLLAADNFYRGIGRTTVTMWCGLFQMLLNCGLNYLLIFGAFGFPRLGAAGAALGTVVAQMVVGLLLVLSITLGPRIRAEFLIAQSWRFRAALSRRLVGLSLPIGVQTALEMGGVAVFSALVARIGDAELAATNAVIQSWSVAFMAAVALSVGATTLVGQCIGAGEPQRSRLVVRRVEKLGYLLTAFLGVIYAFFPRELMSIFVTSSEIDRVLPFARPLFLIVIVCLVFDLKFIILSGALRGAGDTRFPMFVNILSAWLIFVPALVIVTPRFGLIGAWSCFIVHVMAMAVALELRVRGDRWLLEPQFRGSGQRPQEPHEEPAGTAQPDEPASLASSG